MYKHFEITFFILVCRVDHFMASDWFKEFYIFMTPCHHITIQLTQGFCIKYTNQNPSIWTFSGQSKYKHAHKTAHVVNKYAISELRNHNMLNYPVAGGIKIYTV